MNAPNACFFSPLDTGNPLASQASASSAAFLASCALDAAISSRDRSEATGLTQRRLGPGGAISRLMEDRFCYQRLGVKLNP